MSSAKDTITKRSLFIRYINLSVLTLVLLALIALTSLSTIAYIRYRYVPKGFVYEDMKYNGFLPSRNSSLIRIKGGAVISQMKFTGAAAKAGLKMGDLIMKVK